jgi:hypothetical protein
VRLALLILRTAAALVLIHGVLHLSSALLLARAAHKYLEFPARTCLTYQTVEEAQRDELQRVQNGLNLQQAVGLSTTRMEM